ncbi:uncharacterized protein LOC117514320 [Thalassophryne amazonica]|uniref:uncharacterized protein LOC117514320 n=1 Tax=Thalassophryne amazonica TaxID=390379 RepID=UPI001471CE04|nr:uncharacterized protein LOC117514320 [Thalassophryne amazonica]XP_034030607.1 uncharacterized protein LOC117514320 [Thalassophryne amazonica]XP_034030609.1 uncharacterized protein LOC117514320 [Thalassophryne amazonica]
MIGFRTLPHLTICILLVYLTAAKNDAPCQRTKWNNAFSTFLKRHIPSGTPESLDHNEWEKYIRQNLGCNRPTQSFLQPKDMDRVRAVCTSGGGKVYKDNLCISTTPFTFVTVRSESGTCGIRNIREEKKHLILACEKLENQCLPVHFEGNPGNVKPDNNARACQDPQSPDSKAPNLNPTWLWVLSVIFIFVYTY